MTEHIITIGFVVESEAYKALSDLKRDPINANYTISQVCLVKRDRGRILGEDGFDTGVETTDDTATGGLVGSLIGILGGPLGVILGGSLGLLIGSIEDSGDAVQNASLIEKVSQELPEGKTALIALVQEEDPAAFDRNFAGYSVTITRQDAAEIAGEVEKARELEAQMARDARQKLRVEKREEIKQQAAAKREELREKFEAFKAKHFS